VLAREAVDLEGEDPASSADETDLDAAEPRR
jgi:hypothetical protein